MNTKKTLLACALSSVLISSPAISAVPEIDVARVTALMKDRLDQLSQFKESMLSKNENQDIKAEGDAAKIDAFNTAAQVHITRTTQNQADLYNMKRLMESLPTKMACEQSSLQASIDTILCNSKKNIISLNEGAASIDNPAEASSRGKAEVNTVAEQFGYKDLDGDGVITTNDVNSKIASDYFHNNALLIQGARSLIPNGKTNPTVGPEVTEAAIDSSMLLVPGYSSYNHDYGTPETPDQLGRYNQLMRDEAIRSVVFNAYNDIISTVASSNPDEYGPSLLHTMRLQSETFYNESNYEDSVAYIAGMDEVITPYQLVRHLAVEKAKQIEASLQAYEKSLADEMIQATKLDVIARK